MPFKHNVKLKPMIPDKAKPKMNHPTYKHITTNRTIPKRFLIKKYKIQPNKHKTQINKYERFYQEIEKIDNDFEREIFFIKNADLTLMLKHILKANVRQTSFKNPDLIMCCEYFENSNFSGSGLNDEIVYKTTITDDDKDYILNIVLDNSINLKNYNVIVYKEQDKKRYAEIYTYDNEETKNSKYNELLKIENAKIIEIQINKLFNDLSYTINKLIEEQQICIVKFILCYKLHNISDKKEFNILYENYYNAYFEAMKTCFNQYENLLNTERQKILIQPQYKLDTLQIQLETINSQILKTQQSQKTLQSQQSQKNRIEQQILKIQERLKPWEQTTHDVQKKQLQQILLNIANKYNLYKNLYINLEKINLQFTIDENIDLKLKTNIRELYNNHNFKSFLDNLTQQSREEFYKSLKSEIFIEAKRYLNESLNINFDNSIIKKIVEVIKNDLSNQYKFLSNGFLATVFTNSPLSILNTYYKLMLCAYEVGKHYGDCDFNCSYFANNFDKDVICQKIINYSFTNKPSNYIETLSLKANMVNYFTRNIDKIMRHQLVYHQPNNDNLVVLSFNINRLLGDTEQPFNAGHSVLGFKVEEFYDERYKNMKLKKICIIDKKIRFDEYNEKINGNIISNVSSTLKFYNDNYILYDLNVPSFFLIDNRNELVWQYYYDENQEIKSKLQPKDCQVLTFIDFIKYSDIDYYYYIKETDNKNNYVLDVNVHKQDTEERNFEGGEYIHLIRQILFIALIVIIVIVIVVILNYIFVNKQLFFENK